MKMTLLTRYDPFREVLSLREAMDRVFQDSFVPASAAIGRPGPVPTDIVETGDGYRVTAALPGWKPEEINIAFQDGTLTISGEKAKATDETGETGTYRVRERRAESFTRSFGFPVQVDSAKATATFENGELVLTLPKAEVALPRQIKIEPSKALAA
jgi:HSP20 family protein